MNNKIADNITHTTYSSYLFVLPSLRLPMPEKSPYSAFYSIIIAKQPRGIAKYLFSVQIVSWSWVSNIYSSLWSRAPIDPFLIRDHETDAKVPKVPDC